MDYGSGSQGGAILPEGLGQGSQAQWLVLVQARWAALWVARWLVLEQGPVLLARLLQAQEQVLLPQAEEAEWVLGLEVFGEPGQWWTVQARRLAGCWQGAGLWELWQQVAELWVAGSSLSLPLMVLPRGPALKEACVTV